MKQIFSLVLIVVLLMGTISCSPSLHRSQMKKRYYDAWEGNNNNNNDDGDAWKSQSIGQKGSNKEDPCENKPLWFLKSQRKLGKFSPFYNCLHDLE